tara:strand:- start:1012 stop:2274 length:1263 start_codon:yes stop_codon:yes gene_type:complete
MKSFLSFLTESLASQQASRLGLQGDGHGGWYDRKTGEFVAKTEKGRLKFYNKRQKVGGKDPKQSEKEKNLSSPHTESPPKKEVKTSSGMSQTPEDIPKTRGTLTIAFGRFNPPHAGHGKLMDIASQSVGDESDDYMIVPSRTNDPKKNPLDPDTKSDIMRKLFPQHSTKIVNDPNNKTIFDVLKKAHHDGYTNVKIIGGSDRQKQFDRLSQDYNGSLYQFDNLETISSGERKESSSDIEGFSASKMRLAAMEGDFKTFYSQLHNQGKNKSVPLLDKKQANEYFLSVRRAMGVEKVEECWNIWEIAPKDDPENLREAYIKKEIFDIGTKVEDVNTGLIGRIIRRGANHLICVTEDQIMFKSWIKDVTEAIVNGTTISGVPADQRLVGTDAHFKYVQSMVPSVSSSIDWSRRFINKYKVRKK